MSEICDNCLLTYCSYEPFSEECQSARHFENELRIGKNMKAKEYVKKYKDTIIDGPDALAEMMVELCDEAFDLINVRNAQTNDAVLSCFKEINTKYNSICNQLEKCYGHPVLKRDCFKEAMIRITKDKLPELGVLWNSKQ